MGIIQKQEAVLIKVYNIYNKIKQKYMNLNIYNFHSLPSLYRLFSYFTLSQFCAPNSKFITITKKLSKLNQPTFFCVLSLLSSGNSKEPPKKMLNVGISLEKYLSIKLKSKVSFDVARTFNFRFSHGSITS